MARGSGPILHEPTRLRPFGESALTHTPSLGAARRIAPEAASHACTLLLGIEPTRIEYPGGPSRSSVRAVTGDASYIVTRRKHAARAELEAGVLRELRSAGAPVPAVHAFDGEWLIQQDLGPQRLSVALGAADARGVAALAMQAAGGLLLCQLAADKQSLAQRVAPIGLKPSWLTDLLLIPGRVAEQLGVADPQVGAVVRPEQLTPRQLSFVKWDARPGNAVVVESTPDGGGVGWIDWEHCGARDALDDLAWLLCDEYMPDNVALESLLLQRFLPLFATRSGRSPEDALVYLSRFGSLHTCMRLFLVLKHKGEGAWWNPDMCERTDRIGVTAQAARRLCSRGARWAGRWPGGERMHQFFSDADKRVRQMSDAPIQRSESSAIA